MNFNLKIEGDCLSLTVSDVAPTPEERGRVCNVEMALLRHYGSHQSEAVRTDDRGHLTYLFHRGCSDHRLYMECREILKGFGIDPDGGGAKEQYLTLEDDLIALIDAGKEDSKEADDIRDKMDRWWFEMTPHEREDVDVLVRRRAQGRGVL